MKKFIRLVAIGLIVATLLSAFIGCSKKKNPETPADSGTSEPSTGDGWSTLLPDRDFNDLKEWRVLGRDGLGTSQFTNFEFDADADGTLMGDAVFNRNQALEEKYHFEVKYSSSSTLFADVQVLHAAGEDAYDLVVYQISNVQSHATTGYLADLSELLWLDFSAPCWNENANSQLSFMNKLYYTTSDLLLLDKNRTYLNIYNRELAESNGLGKLEDDVQSGNWTYERFYEVQSLLTQEVDGIDGHSSDDRFGLVMDSYNAFVAFAYGGGFRLSDKDDNDTLVLTGAAEQSTNIIEQTLKITCDKEKAMFCNDYNNDWSIANNTFYAHRALITTTFLSVFDTSMSEKCDFEYGFLPFPKLNTEQKDYYTVPDITHSQVFAIPASVVDKDFASYMLELFSEASTNTTLKVFYEQKCKLQQSYDQLCADMLDLIFENIVYDAVLVGNYGNLCSLLNSELPKKKLNVYTGLYKGRVATAEKEIADLITEYQKRA